MPATIPLVLVTGGAGLSGSHHTEVLLERWHSVTLVNELSAGRFEIITHATGHLPIRPASDARCLVPGCDGIKYAALPSQEALWDSYDPGAPARPRPCVERYSIVKKV
jgi:nucleoside-diphosphate-sugar epimerase